MPARDTESPWKSPSSPSRAAAPAQHQVRLGPGNNFSRPKSPLAFGTLAGYSHPDSPQIYATDESGSHSYLSELDGSVEPEQPPEALTYFHTRGLSDGSAQRDSLNQSSPDSRPRSTMSNGNLLARPMSAMLLEPPGRSPSPGVSPDRNRNSVYGRSSPSARPMSYIDLLNAPYPQPAPSASKVQNDALRPAIGLNASLLSSQKTFEMYLANVKKTPDLHTQYSFATFLVRMSQEAREDQAARPPSAAGTVDDSPMSKPDKLVSEARKILESLAGKSYPFAQYYLADGFTSGLFTKSGTPDNDHALPLFVAASKHGHAEAGYRAGLCYEFGWGARRDGPKAWQYFRQSASKGHPGAMGRLSRACLTGDLGQPISEREGVRWLRRAAEKADEQFSSAPYDLGLLHEYGYGSDVFKDEVFAAQLFTKSAGLGHADAAFKMGRAYEHGLLQCPQDSGLSIHFYHTAANAGHSEAMLNLAAWYLLGCEVLEKDEEEAYEWAKRSAALGKLGDPLCTCAAMFFLLTKNDQKIQRASSPSDGSGKRGRAAAAIRSRRMSAMLRRRIWGMSVRSSASRRSMQRHRMVVARMWGMRRRVKRMRRGIRIRGEKERRVKRGRRSWGSFEAGMRSR